MKILAYKDLILSYIRQNYANNEDRSFIEKIFYNENSVFLYSKKFIEFLASEIDENSKDYYRFTAFVDKIQKNFQRKGNIASSEASLNFDEELLHVFSNIQDKVVVSIAYNQPNLEIRNAIPNIAILSQQHKLNYHWLVINLAILHPNKVSVNCFDFQNNNDIKALFDSVFSIPKRISEVYIFDTQCNLEHDRFDNIIKKKVYVKYFTIFVNTKKGPINIENKKSITSKFAGKCKMYTTRPNNAHGRRIIFENFIITCDNDYWNLEVDASDWTIDVQYNEIDAQKWLLRIAKYQEYR